MKTKYSMPTISSAKRTFDIWRGQKSAPGRGKLSLLQIYKNQHEINNDK